MKIINVTEHKGAAFLSEVCVILKPFSLWLGSKPTCGIGEHSLQRYAFAELMEGVTSEKIRALNAETTWALEGTAVGRELT